MLSVQDLMNRPGEPDVEELMARIAALQAENPPLAAGVVKLEEELALARLHRFAPKSERHIDRLFNEAERAADEDDADSEDGDVVVLPDTGLPATEGATGKKRGRKALPENCRASASSMTMPTTRRLVLAAVIRCIVWARPLPSNFISR